MVDRNSPQHADSRRFLARASLRAAFPYFAVALLLLLAVLVLGRELERHFGALEAWIAQFGPWSMLAFIALFVLASSLLVPDTVLCILAGAMFGLAWGLLVVVVGSLIASGLQFTLSRRLLRARIARMLEARPSLAAIQRAVVHEEFRLQVLLRLAPLNPATISYLLGAAGVRLWGFLIACLALTPSLFVEVYVGRAGRHIVRLAGGAVDTDRLQDAAIVGGLAVCLVLLMLVSKIARDALTRALDEPRLERSDSAR